EVVLNVQHSEVQQCPEIRVFHVRGPLFFAASKQWIEEVLYKESQLPSVVVFQMASLSCLGIEEVNDVHLVVTMLNDRGITVYFAGVQSQPLLVLEQNHKTANLLPEILLQNSNDAITAAFRHAPNASDILPMMRVFQVSREDEC
ncbi:MAG: STAS domain-containing protein, partial [Bacilli bacterium]